MRNKLTKRGLQYRIRMFEKAVRWHEFLIEAGYGGEDVVRIAKLEVKKWRQAIIAASYYER